MNNEIKTFIINKLESGEYLLTKNYFGEYIKSLLEQNNYENFDLIKNYLKEESGWKYIESLLEKTLSILQIDEKKLIDQFISENDLVNDQPEKFLDVLNEFATIVKLNEKGFTEIRRPSKKGADFVALYNGERFAIEIKTVRLPGKQEEARIDYNPQEISQKPKLAYEVDELQKILEEKIRNILNDGACKQLKNTAEKENCKWKLLRVSVVRPAMASLLNVKRDDFGEIYKNIKQDYPDIDYFVFNGYWHPKLK